MFEVTAGATVTDQFAVFEEDGFTKHSGLVPGFIVTVWKDGVLNPITVTLSEVGSSGEYKMVYAPPSDGFWKVQVFTPFSDEYFDSFALAGAGIAGLKGDIELVLGLLHQNAMLDQQVFNASGDLTSARLRVFNAPGNVPALPGGAEIIGLKFQFLVEATYTGPGTPDKYTLKRTL